MRRHVRKNNRILIFLIVVLGTVSLAFEGREFLWQKNSNGIRESEIRTIFIHPQDPSLIYAGTSQALYQSVLIDLLLTKGTKKSSIIDEQGRLSRSISLERVNKSKYFKPILTPRGEFKGINQIFFSADTKALYAATDSGLYIAKDGGRRFSREFFSSDINALQCLSVLVSGEDIFLGTKNGAFVKNIHQKEWQKFKPELNNASIKNIIEDNDYVYFASSASVYRWNKKTRDFNKIFSSLKAVFEEEASEETEDTNEEIKFLYGLENDLSGIFIAARKGIFVTFNQGESWQALETAGLPLDEVTSLVVVPTSDVSSDRRNHGSCDNHPLSCLEVWVSTERNVFLQREGKWEAAYQGMETNNVRFLAKGADEMIYAATDKGIFSLARGEALPFIEKVNKEHMALEGQEVKFQEINQDIKAREPTINEVQAWAIDYAQVHPDKIKRWHKQAQHKAWLPSLTMGLDRSDTELYHWDTGTNPDTLIKGKDNLAWDVSLSWDFSDLIFNDDQTSIDSRSKLLVELRESILDQVTRLYFERRRLQVDLMSNEGGDPYLTLEQEMRLEELTALLDAYTGGRFGRNVNNGAPEHKDTGAQENE